MITGILAGFTLLAILGFALSYIRRRRHESREAILDLLQNGPSYGLDLVRSSGGRLGRGTVYIHLHDLEREGIIQSWNGRPSDPKAYADQGQQSRRMFALVEKTDV